MVIRERKADELEKSRHQVSKKFKSATTQIEETAAKTAQEVAQKVVTSTMSKSALKIRRKMERLERKGQNAPNPSKPAAQGKVNRPEPPRGTGLPKTDPSFETSDSGQPEFNLGSNSYNCLLQCCYLKQFYH